MVDLKNEFKFIVPSELDITGYNIEYKAYRSNEQEEVFLVTWTEDNKEDSDIWHEKTIEELLENETLKIIK